MKSVSEIQERTACALFLILVPALAHVLFSWMGFVPSLEGLNLTFSRRLLEGQIPHRDFINIRPIGSALLYLPFVSFCGSYTFWISRLFAWFEFTCIAWAWTTVIVRTLKFTLPVAEKYMLAMIAFLLTVHYFPVAPFYTTDSLFFLSLGLVLSYEGSRRQKFLGYVLMGIAVLCKQSFFLTIPVFLFVLKDWRNIRYWLASALPGIIYFIYLFFSGALSDALFQLTARTDEFFSKGIMMYLLKRSIPWGAWIGYLAMILSFGQIRSGFLRQKMGLQRSLGTLLLYALPLAFAVVMSRDVHRGMSLCLILFGVSIGATSHLILNEEKPPDLARMGLLVLVSGWSASLSTGYNNPALSAGPLAILLIAYGLHAHPLPDRNTLRNLHLVLLVLLFVVSLVSFGITRRKFVFKDQPPAQLTHRLEGLFPGTRFIQTGLNTYQFLSDFKEAVEKTKGRDFAIIPGLPAYWVKSSQKNPLLIDLAVRPEISNQQALIDRVTKDLEAHRGKIWFVLAKVEPDCLSHGFFPLSNGKIPQYVRDHFTKSAETKYFELYQ